MGCGGSTPTTTEEKPIHVAPPSSRPHPEPVKLASPAPVSNPVPVPHQPPLGLAPPLPPALATEPQPDLKLVQNPPSEEVPRDTHPEVPANQNHRQTIPSENGEPFHNPQPQQERSQTEYSDDFVTSSAGPGPSDPHSDNVPLELRTFRYRELQRATQNFKDPDMVLGEGGFGKVYKGWLKDPSVGPDQFPVAVKRLNPDGVQGQREWLAEILLLGRLRHPNLVRLIGFCPENGEGILVYEFVSKGSLDFHLFPELNSGLEPLSWTARLKVALDAAQGLAYLHDQNIIHRDFKAPNILLGDEFEAKLTDFGLAKEAEGEQTHVTTRIMGTMGYLDPKYMETGQLTKKSDVYAFGVILLELLSGRRAMDPDNPDGQPLTAWAQQFLAQRRPDINALVDPYLREEIATRKAQKAAHKLAISAKHCIEENPTLRPLMSDMVETLRPLVPIDSDDV